MLISLIRKPLIYNLSAVLIWLMRKPLICILSAVLIWLMLSISLGLATKFSYNKLCWYNIRILPELSLEVIKYDGKYAFVIFNYSCADAFLVVGDGALIVSVPKSSMSMMDGNAYLLRDNKNIPASQLGLYKCSSRPAFAAGRVYSGEELNYLTLMEASLSEASINAPYKYKFNFFKQAIDALDCDSNK